MRALNSSGRSLCRGFTLVELSISVTVLALVGGSIGAIVLSGRHAYDQGMRVSSIEMQARRTLDRVATEFTGAVRTSLTTNPTAPLGASTLQFRQCEGSGGGVVLTSPPMRIAWRSDPRDANDGVDNDNDGLIDEGEVVLTRDVGAVDETEAVLVRNVAEYLEGETPNLGDDNGNGLNDERGLSFVMDADGTMTIRLTLAALDPDNRVVLRTTETSVHLRN